MKVIIVGAGEVGRVSAETIANIHDVLVIERDETVLNILKSRLNVSTLKADGTNPKTIQYAIDNHDADMIIATLGSDSANLFVCLMAKRFKPSIITVSSVNNPDYMIETSAQGVEGVDTIISPELITAQKMYKLCTLENAIDYENMANMDTSVAIFTVGPQHATARSSPYTARTSCTPRSRPWRYIPGTGYASSVPTRRSGGSTSSWVSSTRPGTS